MAAAQAGSAAQNEHCATTSPWYDNVTFYPQPLAVACLGSHCGSRRVMLLQERMDHLHCRPGQMRCGAGVECAHELFESYGLQRHGVDAQA